MKTIQIVIDKPLLKEANREAKRTGVSRSALIRDVLREHLNRKKNKKDLDERERRGYLEQPDSIEDAEAWARVAAWPSE